MESLFTGLLSQLGDQGVEKIAQSAGINSDTAKTILKQAGPLLTAKIAKNAQEQSGLESLDKALESHDASVFDSIDDIVDPNVDTKGSKILNHVLGSSGSTALASVLGAKNGTDQNTTGKILEMVAPLVLGQLGAEKKSQGLDTAGLQDMLSQKKENIESSGDSMFMELAKNFIDQDNDGSVVDDLMGMASSFLNKK